LLIPLRYEDDSEGTWISSVAVDDMFEFVDKDKDAMTVSSGLAKVEQAFD
jgi:hypothetical protein